MNIQPATTRLFIKYNMDEDDLYDDLEHTVASKQPPPSHNLQLSTKNTTIKTSASASTLSAQPKIITLSQSEITQLQQQIKSLQAENDILKKNIGILYRTAKSELQRKDKTVISVPYSNSNNSNKSK